MTRGILESVTEPVLSVIVLIDPILCSFGFTYSFSFTFDSNCAWFIVLVVKLLPILLFNDKFTINSSIIFTNL